MLQRNLKFGPIAKTSNISGNYINLMKDKQDDTWNYKIMISSYNIY